MPDETPMEGGTGHIKCPKCGCDISLTGSAEGGGGSWEDDFRKEMSPRAGGPEEEQEGY